ncbi:hypothetical protein Hanom_Chr16g01499501 [Helianthus anomalus]
MRVSLSLFQIHLLHFALITFTFVLLVVVVFVPIYLCVGVISSVRSAAVDQIN